MSLFVLLLTAACIALETVEQVFFRMSGVRRPWWLFVGLGSALNLIGMGVWLIVLRHAQLGEVVPLLAATNVTVAMAGKFLFREPVSLKRWIGIGLITFGVALVSTSVVP
jgi:drug/metabolite transporter (DMT)-like permease